MKLSRVSSNSEVTGGNGLQRKTPRTFYTRPHLDEHDLKHIDSLEDKSTICTVPPVESKRRSTPLASILSTRAAQGPAQDRSRRSPSIAFLTARCLSDRRETCLPGPPHHDCGHDYALHCGRDRPRLLLRPPPTPRAHACMTSSEPVPLHPRASADPGRGNPRCRGKKNARARKGGDSAEVESFHPYSGLFCSRERTSRIGLVSGGR